MNKLNRLTREEYVCLLALAAATRSEDPFTQAGAALLDIHGNVLGTGTNGLKSGVSIPDWMFDPNTRIEKAELMIHAEANLWQRKKEGEEYLLGLTINPCSPCSKLIIASKIKKVVFINLYPSDQGFRKIFDFHGVEYSMLGPESKNRIKNALLELIKKI